MFFPLAPRGVQREDPGGGGESWSRRDGGAALPQDTKPVFQADSTQQSEGTDGNVFFSPENQPTSVRAYVSDGVLVSNMSISSLFLSPPPQTMT